VRRGEMGMRSDERFFFFLAATVMSFCVIYTLFWHVFPLIENRHNFVYAHCTVTGNGRWEKYETIEGIKERVAVPVEVRIGPINSAMSWTEQGADVLKSSDIYHQGLARDEPSGWRYFTPEDKVNYLDSYKPGNVFDCYARPSTDFRDVVFHKEAIMHRIIPQLLFVGIILFLCVATGVCLGIIDAGRKAIGLPGAAEGYGPKDGGKAGQEGDAKALGESASYGTYPRQFSAEKEREWV